MNKRRLKILLMTDEARIGGGQKHILLLATSLNRKKYDVAVACERQGYLVDQLQKAGIRHLTVEMSNRLSPKSLRGCMNALREFKPDVLHTHGGTPGLWGRLAARLSGVPIVVHTYHGLHILYRGAFVRAALLWLERALLRITSHIICVSSADFVSAKQHRLLRVPHASIVRNGVVVGPVKSSSVGKKLRARLSIPSKGIIVGSIGRMHHQKGYFYLLRAASVIVRERKDVYFVLVGDGPQMDQVQQESERMGLADHVRFMGAVDNASELIPSFDMFVLPSLWEGFPIVLLEASAAARPIIATAINGNMEIVRDGVNGILVPPRDPKRLSEAILQLVAQPALRRKLGKSARSQALREYDVKKMVKNITDIYETLNSQFSGATA